MTKVKLAATVDVTVESHDDCGIHGETHWYWTTRGDWNASDCFRSFSEAVEDAQNSLNGYMRDF